MRPQILYSSKEVRLAIADLFKDRNIRRIAISAYVGNGAEPYLPYRKDLHLICSPTPGGTNPRTLRKLKREGVKVEFVDSLHMKLYWAAERGSVITSANLSTNALGIGGLKELGILLDPGVVNITRVLKQLKPRAAEGSELHALDVKHRKYHAANPRLFRPSSTATFTEWHDSPHPEKWKLLCFDESATKLSETAIRAIKEEFGTQPYDWFWSEKACVQEGEWVLCAPTTTANSKGPSWVYVHRLISVPKRDRVYPNFPFEVIQVHTAKHYEAPPFKLDAKVRSALRHFADEKHVTDSSSPINPPSSLIRAVYRACSTTGAASRTPRR